MRSSNAFIWTSHFFIEALNEVRDVASEILEEKMSLLQVRKTSLQPLDLALARDELIHSAISVGLVPTVDLSLGIQPKKTKWNL